VQNSAPGGRCNAPSGTRGIMKAICNRNNFKEERVAGCITDVMSVAHMGNWGVMPNISTGV
ncbi:hypothetical protein, partial [Pantoea ananatis]|uniref:hypothetical protein n=1 Tax=Pantoea ananas TaxID=553 RepID=UPI001C31D563